MAASLAKKAVSFLTSIAIGRKADEADVNEADVNLADVNLTVQFANEVKDFSSQYGEENSESYTARNLAGNDRIFSSCGDFYQACAFRTYGPWWKMAPSARKPFEGTAETFPSDDYIEITFATKVYPVKLEIYETDYPGAIVHILACEMMGTDVDTGIDMYEWVTLWQGRPEKLARQSRIFSPPLKQCPFSTDLLRLELCHDLAQYYTQLDCVKLHGTVEQRACDSSVKKDIIQGIHSDLDLSRLLSTEETCRLQCKELNLQPFWTKVTDTALKDLNKFSQLQRLNFSWCKNPLLTINGVKTFLQCCGRELTCLYMSTCKFVNNDCLMSVVQYCPNLKELDIDSCPEVDSTGFSQLKNLTQLQRLNLYRTCIDTESLVAIIRSCHDLQHLNLGSCIYLHSMDDIAYELGKNCRKLKSLDLWRSESISHEGLGWISVDCPALEEIDLGWCPELKFIHLCFRELSQRCTKLKKLFLTGNTTVCDYDLLDIAKYCKEMEQLDILGTRQVSSFAAQRFLESCEKLRLFDVSFCPDIDFTKMERWKKDFPHCEIKSSFENS